VRDILLLSRPDYTVYDEVRNTSDFELYKDLRLTGIGLVGVIHATRAVDSIQRFLGTIEMGVIPQVIDTVIYIDK
jgi:ATPase